MGAPIEVAVFGDPNTVGHVRALLGLDPGLLVRAFSAKSPLAGLATLRRARVAHGVMASSMWKVFRRAKRAGALTVNHWIGTDVHETLREPSLRASLEKARPLIDLHFAVAPWLCSELAELGIEAKELPIVPADLRVQQMAPPVRHGVLAYAAPGREAFYGIALLAQLAERFPGVPFVVCGGGRVPEGAPANLVAAGRVGPQEMERLYQGASVLVRLPEHDGLSKMVIEALVRGRAVVWNQEFKGAHYASDAEGAARVVGALLAEPPGFQKNAAAVATRFDPRAVAARARALYEERLDRLAGRG